VGNTRAGSNPAFGTINYLIKSIIYLIINRPKKCPQTVPRIIWGHFLFYRVKTNLLIFPNTLLSYPLTGRGESGLFAVARERKDST
jgi:hypothetical protein